MVSLQFTSRCNNRISLRDIRQAHGTIYQAVIFMDAYRSHSSANTPSAKARRPARSSCASHCTITSSAPAAT